MATTYTTILGSDSLSDGRVKINANYLTIESDIEAVQTIADNKVGYTGSAPAVGDMLVAWATSWLLAQKKVFTASQVLVSDSNGQPTSEAKGTAFNKDFGTASTQVPTGNSVVLLTTDQTVAGIKTFSSFPVTPSTAPTTDYQAANKAYVDSQAASKISIVTTDVTVSNTTTETSLVSVSIPWNTLWTNNAVRVRFFVSSTTNQWADVFALKLKYGSTTLITVSNFDAQNLTLNGYIECYLFGSGATNTQEGNMLVELFQDNVDTTATSNLRNFAVGTAAEDSTWALNLVVSIQFSGAGAPSANDNITVSQIIVDKIS